MNLRERLSHFWNVTLGEDYPEMENIEESNDSKYAELKESLERVNAMASNFNKPSTGKKGGKGGKGGKGSIVENVSVDEKAAAKVAAKVAEAKKGNKGKAKEIEGK